MFLTLCVHSCSETSGLSRLRSDALASWIIFCSASCRPREPLSGSESRPTSLLVMARCAKKVPISSAALSLTHACGYDTLAWMAVHRLSLSAESIAS